MLMANSVEGRFPFLDRDVVEFANGSRRGTSCSASTRSTCSSRPSPTSCPSRSCRRPKQPYRAPDAASFFAGRHARTGSSEVTVARGRRRGAASSSRGWSRGLLAKCRAHRRRTGMGNTDNMRLLAVVSTQLLHRQFVVDGGASAERRRTARRR